MKIATYWLRTQCTHFLGRWKTGEIADNFLITRRTLVDRSPAVVPFYFLNRSKENDLGRKIREKEREFRNKLGDYFPKLTEVERDGVYALFYGIPFCGAIHDEAVRAAIDLLLSALKKTTESPPV